MVLKDVGKSLEGVILVTSSSKGHKLVWYYDCHQEVVESKTPRTTFHNTLGEEYLIRTQGHHTSRLFDELDVTLIADILSPKVGLCDKRFQLTLNQFTYLGHPVTLSQDDVYDRGESKVVLPMSLFHVVFLMRNTRQDFLTEVYRQVVRPLTMALKHEQLRCGYVANEIDIILSTGDSITSAEDLQDQLYKVSRFVRELTDIANGLKRARDIDIHINNWIRFGFSFEEPLTYGWPIHPYQTILLFDSSSRVIDSLPERASSTLIEFLENVDSRKNFLELSRDLLLTLEQVVDLARHVVTWNRGRIIVPANIRNFYAIAHDAPIETLLIWKDRFREAFPEKDFFKILDLFFEPRTFDDCLDEKQISLEILEWLLRHRWINQLQTCIYIIDSVKKSILTKNDETFVETVNRIVANKPPAIAELFRRICVYFNGCHTIAEIVWREDLNWIDMEVILSRFKKDLVLCIYDQQV